MQFKDFCNHPNTIYYLHSEATICLGEEYTSSTKEQKLMLIENIFNKIEIIFMQFKNRKDFENEIVMSFKSIKLRQHVLGIDR